MLFNTIFLLAFANWFNAVNDQSYFSERADRIGLQFTYFNGAHGQFYFPEITGGGAALFDFDGDGDIDIFLVQGAQLNQAVKADPTVAAAMDLGGRLYRNNLTEDGELRFTDVTEASGIRATGYGQGAAIGDVNGDGLPDLYVTNFGPNQLWLNRGQGRFEDVTTAAGVGDPRWSTSATLFDFDGDGLDEIYVCNYVSFDTESNPKCFASNSARDYCGPDCCPAAADRLYLNRGDVGFEDASTLIRGREAGAGLSVVAFDYDGDGFCDLFVANDGDANDLLHNRAGRRFENEALFSGVALNGSGTAEASMGIALGDFDGDGDRDLFLTHLDSETNTLYVNQGSGLFVDRTARFGLSSPSLPFTGFGTGWLDVDNDGWLDLIAVNGAVRSQTGLADGSAPLRQKNQLFMNHQGQRFTYDQVRGGRALETLNISRGTAFGDLDNDGDCDFLVVNLNTPIQVFINNVGQRSPWVGLDLKGPGQRVPIGARVEVRTASRSMFRWVSRDGSYASSNDPRVLFGLGRETDVAKILVTWPDGTKSELAKPTPGHYHQIKR